MQHNSNNYFWFEGNFVANPKFSEFDKTGKDGTVKSNAVVRFTLALDGGKDGSGNETNRISFEAWDTAADILSEFRKGDRISGYGLLRNTKWVDKEGNKRHDVVCRVSRFFVVNKRSNDDNYHNSEEDSVRHEPALT